MAAWLALLILVLSGIVLVGRHDVFVVGGMDAAQLAMAASGVLLAVWLSGALLPQLRDTHPRTYKLVLRGGRMGCFGSSQRHAFQQAQVNEPLNLRRQPSGRARPKRQVIAPPRAV